MGRRAWETRERVPLAGGQVQGLTRGHRRLQSDSRSIAMADDRDSSTMTDASKASPLLRADCSELVSHSADSSSGPGSVVSWDWPVSVPRVPRRPAGGRRTGRGQGRMVAGPWQSQAGDVDTGDPDPGPVPSPDKVSRVAPEGLVNTVLCHTECRVVNRGRDLQCLCHF